MTQRQKGRTVKPDLKRVVTSRAITPVIDLPDGTQRKPRLALIGDAACPTGFAQVNHNVIQNLDRAGWDVHVLAVNYYGDPHPIQQYATLYSPTANRTNDYYGFSRVVQWLQAVQPDCIFINNDLWIVSRYLKLLRECPIPIVIYSPIDSAVIPAAYIEELTLRSYDVQLCVPTEFGRRSVLQTGYNKPVEVIPHGIDTSVFSPVAKQEAKQKLGLTEDSFIVQVVDRNSVRKRVDIAFAAFARFVRTVRGDSSQIYLYYHGDLHDPEGYDLKEYARQLGITDRLIVTSEHLRAGVGVPLQVLPTIYSAADVKISSSGAEGWGLTSMEAMACGTATVAVNYSAIPSWAGDAVSYCDPVTDTYGDPVLVPVAGQLTTAHAVCDIDSLCQQLHRHYSDSGHRNEMAKRGLTFVRQPHLQWSSVTAQFQRVLMNALTRYYQTQ